MSGVLDQPLAQAPPSRPSRRKPSPALLYSMLGAVLFFWSLNYVIGKIALRSFPPMLLSGLRTAIAGLLMVPVYAATRQRDRRAGWTRRDVPQLLAVGVLGIALNQFLFVVGLGRTSVAHASILNALNPVMVLLIAAALGMERIRFVKVVGLGFALTGVAVLHLGPSRGPHATIAGDALILAGAVAFSAFTVAGKRISSEFGGVTVNTFGYVAGAIALAPITIWQSIGFSYERVPLAAWASLFYMAAFPAVICYLIFYWALEYLPASRASAVTYVQPVLATAMAVPLLGEPVSATLVAGGALVFAGVFLSERG